MPKIIRVTTVPMALKVLLRGQMRYMQENGFEVIMVSADGKELADVLHYEKVRHHLIPMTRKITPIADLVSLWRLYWFFKKEKPDIVHSHTPKAGLLAMLAAKMAGVKVRIHTVAGLRFMTSVGKTRQLLVKMEKLTGQWATHVWPNSFSLKDYIETQHLVTKNKLEVIGLGSSNGINLERFSVDRIDPVHLNEVKQLIGYNEESVYLLCVGRIVKDKGIDELLFGFTSLYKANNRLRLIMVGPFEDELDPVSEESRQVLKTHPGIVLAGWRDDVEYFMHLSFALIHASYREGFPNVLLQAGAMHCPVLCSRIEGNVDIVAHQQTGLLFEVKNKEDLLEKVETGINHPALLKQYADALQQKVRDHFDQQVIHKQLLSRYRELLDETGL